MTIERKVGMGIAGQASGATDVADVFSTDLYTGTGSALTINNGINLSGKGGLVWIKSRTVGTHEHALLDTERGDNKELSSETSAGQSSVSGFGSFLSNGFSFVNGGDWYNIQQNNVSYASWTFRKKKKFFDIVTWTGNDVVGRTIPHGLDGDVGMIIAKRYDASSDWVVWHKNLAATKYLKLNQDSPEAASATVWGSATPTSTVFSVGDAAQTNGGSQNYIAYVFADNQVEDAEEQMIKCGSFSTDGAGKETITLGWEPQFVLVKRSDAGGNGSWEMIDSMREFASTGNSKTIRADTNAVEASVGYTITSTGFKDNGAAAVYADFIYMAIRAPMMVEPKAATDVFALDTWGSTGDGKEPAIRSGFPVDFVMYKTSGSHTNAASRLTGGNYFRLNRASGESYDQPNLDYNNGYGRGDTSTNSTVGFMWKRAKGFFDAVAYSGTNSAKTVTHSLGVVPEMMWVKRRNGTPGWQIYTAEGAGSKYLHLDENYMYSTNASRFNNTAATSSVFTVGTGDATNGSSYPYIALLFATLDGISKCGTYTGNGSSQTISCGFSAGARFILIKRTTGSEGDWFFWDSLRGIVAGNDPHLSANTEATQVTTDDSVDPANSGFIVNQVSATDINVNSSNYIFYAIA